LSVQAICALLGGNDAGHARPAKAVFTANSNKEYR